MRKTILTSTTLINMFALGIFHIFGVGCQQSKLTAFTTIDYSDWSFNLLYCSLENSVDFPISHTKLESIPWAFVLTYCGLQFAAEVRSTWTKYYSTCMLFNFVCEVSIDYRSYIVRISRKRKRSRYCTELAGNKSAIQCTETQCFVSSNYISIHRQMFLCKG